MGQRTLTQKLGIKAGMNAILLNQPAHYFDLVVDLPEGVRFNEDPEEPADFIHFFTKDHEELEETLPQLKEIMQQNGMIWISWPKKASKVATDVSGNQVRSCALSNGLVDVKVCSLDDVWSGMKLMIRVRDRK